MTSTTIETASEPITATSTAELIDALDGQPFYIDKQAHVPGRTLPDELWNGLMSESALMMMARTTDKSGTPPKFHLWMLGEVLEGRLPVPDYMLIDAQFNERQLAAKVPIRSEDNPEGKDAMQRYMTFGGYLYYQRFPERCPLDDEHRARLAERYERLISTGYRVPELEAALATS